MKLTLLPLCLQAALAASSTRYLRGLSGSTASASSNNCYIHSGCSGSGAWSDDSSNSLGAGWYCTDGEPVSDTSDFDDCDDSMLNCPSGSASFNGGAWQCDEEGMISNGYCGMTDPESDQANNFCGSTDDPWTELSCSMYQYRPKAGQWDGNVCGNDPSVDGFYLGVMANGEGFYQNGQPQINPNTNAWAGNFDGTGNSDYWVFHGCDGAGLQSDCIGNVKYIERFSYLHTADDASIIDGVVQPPGTAFEEAHPDGICGEFTAAGDETRNYCKFVHPGTNRVYSDYHGGWWGSDNPGSDAFGSAGMGFIDFGDGSSNSCGDFGSAWTGCWTGPLMENTKAIPDNFDGNHPFDGDGENFSFMLYDFRCEEMKADSHYFSYPSIAKYGWKCFVDNEPGQLGYPPSVEIYFGTLTQVDGKVAIKMLRWDSDQWGNVKAVNADSPWVMYPVQEDDGSGVPY